MIFRSDTKIFRSLLPTILLLALSPAVVDGHDLFIDAGGCHHVHFHFPVDGDRKSSCSTLKFCKSFHRSCHCLSVTSLQHSDAAPYRSSTFGDENTTSLCLTARDKPLPSHKLEFFNVLSSLRIPLWLVYGNFASPHGGLRKTATKFKLDAHLLFTILSEGRQATPLQSFRHNHLNGGCKEYFNSINESLGWTPQSCPFRSTSVKCEIVHVEHLDPIEDNFGEYHRWTIYFGELSLCNSYAFVVHLFFWMFIIWFEDAIKMDVLNL